MKYVDAHTHLVEKKSDNLISYPTYSATVDLTEAVAPFWCGLHPLDISIFSMDREALIDKLTSIKSNLIGVGEIGLDFGGKNIDKTMQYNFLTCQLDFAKEYGLPVTIHCVKAYNELITTLKHYKELKIMVHSFVGSKQIANELILLGCYLSFSGISLASPKTVDALRNIPLERVLIESDAEAGVMKTSIEENYLRINKILNLNNIEKQIYDNYLCLIS